MIEYVNIAFRENSNYSGIKFYNFRVFRNKETCDDIEKCSDLEINYLRYFRYDNFLEMLKKNKLVFVNPLLWDDPFERLYLNTRIVLGDKSYVPKKVFCLCGRNSNNNEAALWKTYSTKHEPVIRVKFHADKLFQCISDFAKTNNCRVYCSKIIYKDKNTIQDPQKIKSYIKGGTLEEKYISLMSLKRLSFNYEKECRLFIVPEDDNDESFKDDILEVPIGNEVFKYFTISPLEKETQNENNNNETEEEKQIREQKEQEEENKWKDLEKSIKEYISDTDAKVSKTRLYKPITPISEICL